MIIICPYCNQSHDINPAALLTDMSPADLRTLRAIINGKLGKRTITKEQQDAMQAGRRKKG